METLMNSLSSLSSLSDDELHSQTVITAKKEQSLTLLTIEHLHEVNRRRLFSKLGFGSIFAYAVKALGFSEPGAAERVQAMRLVDAVPEVAAKIKQGDLTLSSAAVVQRFIRKEEKATERRITPQEKRALVEKVAGQSVRETQKTLIAQSVEPEAHQLREKERPVSATRTELKLFADAKLMADIERIRELKGDLKLEEIFLSAVGVYLAKIDPGRKPVPPADAAPHPTSELKSKAVVRGNFAPSASLASTARTATPLKANVPKKYSSRCIPVRVRRLVQQRSGGQCEFTDEQTARRCESRHRLQLDHRHPFARGGTATVTNLRHVCPNHNTLAAIEAFGRAKMGRYIRV
jgi:hypothetical protein